MQQVKIYGLGRHQMVAGRFWNAEDIKNGRVSTYAEDSGKGELVLSIIK